MEARNPLPRAPRPSGATAPPRGGPRPPWRWALPWLATLLGLAAVVLACVFVPRAGWLPPRSDCRAPVACALLISPVLHVAWRGAGSNQAGPLDPAFASDEVTTSLIHLLYEGLVTVRRI
jgi:hypothetical protein